MAVDITKIIEPIKSAVEPFTGSIGDAWSAVLGDRIAAWRLKNAAALQVTINSEIAKLGLALNHTKIPERYAFAWFDEATKQDEPEIQKIFARLLAQAAAGNHDALDRRQLEIVTRLTPLDAQILDYFFLSQCEEWWEGQLYNEARTKFGAGSDKSVEYLITLGVFERNFEFIDQTPQGESFQPGEDVATEVHCRIWLTYRGQSLKRACLIP